MAQDLRLVLAQSRCVVGDIAGNVAHILSASQQAREHYQADVIVFPELCLSGYPPEDLLLRPDFHRHLQAALRQLQQQITGIAVVVGHPWLTPEGLYNAASVFAEGQLLGRYYKHHLPNYGVFDEKRYFVAGHSACVVTVKDTRMGLTICEDIWLPGPVLAAQQAGADLILTLNASPFHAGKAALREAVIHQGVQQVQRPLVYVNLVGGQDELVFDGASVVMNSGGEVVLRAPAWVADLYPIDFRAGEPQPALQAPSLPEIAQIYQGLVLGIRDYVQHNGFSGAVIGLSGGIDSALTLALAVDALGPEQVSAVMMPSRYTASMSREDATAEAHALGVSYEEISIEPLFQAFLSALAPTFAGYLPDVTEENIQARCRGIVLMAISNKKRKIVLTTGNKSEMAVGYATLYGDMAGGFAPLKDVFKTTVYRLAEYRNQLGSVIPQRVLVRPPTAELAENQTDQDSLPPYPVLDAILALYIEQDQSIADIVAQGFVEAVVRDVVRRVDQNEYKRRQAPPGIKITPRAFGRDRRYPITSRFSK